MHSYHYKLNKKKATTGLLVILSRFIKGFIDMSFFRTVDQEEAMGEKQVPVQDAQQSELKINTFLQYHVLASLLVSENKQAKTKFFLVLINVIGCVFKNITNEIISPYVKM